MSLWGVLSLEVFYSHDEMLLPTILAEIYIQTVCTDP